MQTRCRARVTRTLTLSAHVFGAEDIRRKQEQDTMVEEKAARRKRREALLNNVPVGPLSSELGRAAHARQSQLAHMFCTSRLKIGVRLDHRVMPAMAN